MTQIANRIAIVTGANRGIGKAIVSALLNNDIAKVYACARNTDSLNVFEDERVTAIQLDITNTDQIKQLVEQTKDADMLINNAGVNTVGSLLHTEFDQVSNDLNINFLGTLNVVRHLYPTIETNGGGNIVNIISICALAAMPNLGGYSVSKAALFSASQALRTELKPKNIILNSVYPGPVDTDMNEGLEIEMASPEDLAQSILDEVIAGNEDIFPDPMSQNVYATWRKDPKLLEQDFSKY